MKTGAGKTASASTTLKVVQAVYEYAYTGNYQTFTVPYTGTYMFEVWGAQGGCGFYFDSLGGYPSIDSITRVGGKGAYAKGTIKLTAGEQYYIYVGGQGACNPPFTNYDSVPNVTASDIQGGYNGGGNGGGFVSAKLGEMEVRISSAGGGGATDIRKVAGAWNDTASLASRIIVAGGGGGYYGGGGGGTGFLDISGEDVTNQNYSSGGGGGGSSYLDSDLFSSRIFIDGNYSGSIQVGDSMVTGNSGNGKAKITILSID